MTRVLGVALVALAGCASGGVLHVEDEPLYAAGWSGAPPHVLVELTGAGAGAAEQQRCRDAVARARAVVDAAAPIQALVTLAPGGNRLQVTSTRHGLVRDEARPGGSIEHLCNDALYALVGAIRRESHAVAAPLLGPARMADDPPQLRGTSGSPNRGPLSDPPY